MNDEEKKLFFDIMDDLSTCKRYFNTFKQVYKTNNLFELSDLENLDQLWNGTALPLIALAHIEKNLEYHKNINVNILSSPHYDLWKKYTISYNNVGKNMTEFSCSYLVRMDKLELEDAKLLRDDAIRFFGKI